MTFITLVGILPQLIGLISRFIDLVNKKSGNDAVAYVSDINSALDKAMMAKTPEDHAEAAKSIALALAGRKQ
jgi:hypothetical protein